MGKESTQIGCEISSSLWSRFREDVRQRRGRINGVLGSEVENALEAYLDGSQGGDVTDELRRLRNEIGEVKTAVAADGGTDPSQPHKKEKNNSRVSKDSVRTGNDAPVGDGGLPVDDRELTGDGTDDRSCVERRTDAALSELISKNPTQFSIGDLDDAIENGAGVGSKPSIERYRERVFDRLGGRDDLVHPKHRARPPQSQIFFVDPDDARFVQAGIHVENGASIQEAADAVDLDPERVRDDLPAGLRAAVRIRDDGERLQDAADAEDVHPEFVEDFLPRDVARDARARDEANGEDDAAVDEGVFESDPVTSSADDSVAQQAGIESGDD